MYQGEKKGEIFNEKFIRFMPKMTQQFFLQFNEKRKWKLILFFYCVNVFLEQEPGSIIVYV